MEIKLKMMIVEPLGIMGLSRWAFPVLVRIMELKKPRKCKV